MREAFQIRATHLLLYMEMPHICCLLNGLGLCLACAPGNYTVTFHKPSQAKLRRHHRLKKCDYGAAGILHSVVLTSIAEPDKDTTFKGVRFEIKSSNSFSKFRELFHVGTANSKLYVMSFFFFFLTSTMNCI